MQIKAEDIRRHYESLSDEALLEIDPTELTEVARQCYQTEMEKRGLTEDAPPAGEEWATDDEAIEDTGVDPDWLEHASCPVSYRAVPGSNHAADVSRARDVLTDAGIPCHVSVIPPDPNSGSHYDEYQILVPAGLNLKAVSVLDCEIFNPDMEADWSAHFAQLSDDELKALKPEVICAGLLDRAQRLKRVWQDEISHRKSG